MWKFIHKLASPPHFYNLAPKLVPWLTVPGVLLIVYGVYAGLFLAPADYQQGDAFRIIYIHVPSAYLSMMAYMIMAVSAAIGLIWRIKLSHAVAAAAAPLGAWFTFLRSTIDIRTHYVVCLFRLHGSTRSHRRYGQGRQSQRCACARRRS
jgi:heme exporter protein C